MKLEEKRRTHVTVNQEACQGCQRCIHVCMYGVYRWDKERNVSIAAYPEECTTCRHCEFYCPAKCIDVQAPKVVFYYAVYDPLGLND